MLAGAAGTAALGYKLVLRRSAPLFAANFNLPTNSIIDARLITGAALFGVGWGLVGLCPGPALAGLGFAFNRVAVFVFAMLAGIDLFRKLAAKSASSRSRRTARDFVACMDTG